MSRSGGWKEFALTAVLLAAVGAPAVILAVRASPARLPEGPAFPIQTASAQPNASICTANAALDTSRDPAWLSASFENDHCQAPGMPAPLEGYTATREQIVAGMAAVKSYRAQSAAYQKCIGDFVASHRGRPGNPVSKSFILVETHRILVSEKSEKKADNQIEVAINAFNEYGSECAE